MSKIRIGAVLAAAAASALLLSGVAIAAPTVQDPTCGVALSRLVDARAELNSAQAAYNELPERVPNSKLADLEKAVVDAKAELSAALGKTLEYDATDPGNVYSGLPGGAPPANADGMTLAFLKLILADEDLGGGARAEVQAAIAAFGKVAAAEKALESGRTVPNPALTSGPIADRLEDAQDAADAAQDVADKACEGQQGDPGPPAPRPTPRVVPNTSSGVDTGDGSLA